MKTASRGSPRVPTQSPLTSVGKSPDHQSPSGEATLRERSTRERVLRALRKTRLSGGLCIHRTGEAKSRSWGAGFVIFQGEKQWQPPPVLLWLVTSCSSAAFRVSPSRHCRLRRSHPRCLPWGGGASPVSVEPQRWSSDSESPTAGDAGAHIPVTLQRAVS